MERSVSTLHKPEMALVDRRGEVYDQLFRGELPYEPLAPEQELGIAGFARNIERRGIKTTEQTSYLDQLPDIIDRILSEHDDLSRQDEPGKEAIFSFIDSRSRKLVTSITTDIFSQWEIAQMRNTGEPILINQDSSARRLVIETAAAVMQVTMKMKEHNLDIKMKSAQKAITKMVASWGPKMARQWMDGTIINKWMEEEGLSQEERTTWRDTFTPGLRLHFAVRNFVDPLGAVRRVKQHLETTLSDQSLAAELGIDEAAARETFIPSLRLHFAVNNISDPLGAVRRVKQHLETTLSNQSLAAELGIDEDTVRETFTTGLRRHFAVHNIADPLGAIRRYYRGELKYGGRFLQEL